MSWDNNNPIILRALNELRNEDGVIMPEAVVNAARSESSPLHVHFEWDDSEAAEQYRLWQARSLLRVMVTVLPGTREPVRAFVSLSNEEGYRLTANVMVHAEHRSQMLEDALKDMKVFQRKYEHLAEVADVIAAMKKAQRRELQVQ